jgi:hypothetical protein
MSKTLPTPWFEYKVPIYGGRLVIYDKRETLLKALKKLRINSSVVESDMCGIFIPITLPTGSTMYLIGWFDKIPSTLLHELSHAVFNILSSRHIGKNEESFCYIIQHLFSRINREKE